jgi:3-oxoacyl-[acyl-carrier protein] reductase
MDLNNKNAVVYGAAGSLGSAVSKALAAAGATVVLTGRKQAALEQITDEIISAGGKATIAILDAQDEQAVSTHLQHFADTHGSVDISFNLTGTAVVQNVPLTTISANDFMGPVSFLLRTHFVTATAAARLMTHQKSGVILCLTATPGGIGYPYTGGFAPALVALETFYKNLAGEIGKYGVRAVNIRSAGSPDSGVFKAAIDANPEVMKPILASMEADTMLKQLPKMADITNVAVFLASDYAAKITGVTIDVTAGTTSGLNYRANQ